MVVGQVSCGPDALRHCPSPGRRARFLAVAISLRSVMYARDAWRESRYCMTQYHSALLLIPFLVGLVLAYVLLRPAIRKILPTFAMAIATLAIPISIGYSVSGRGRAVIVSLGFRSALSEALLVGLDGGRLHRGLLPSPRLYLWRRKKAADAGRALGNCRFLHTQSNRNPPLFFVPRAASRALPSLRASPFEQGAHFARTAQALRVL